MAAKSEGGRYNPSKQRRKGIRTVRQQRQQARVPLDDPGYFTQPLTPRMAEADARRAGDLRYGGVQSQIALQQRQVPAWFDQYKASLQTPQQVQAQYAPVIAQQQQAAQQTAKPLGLEGPAGEQDQLAAKAREALANLGTSVLTGQQQADTTYFQGRQGVANAAQIGALSQLGQQAQQVAGERGAYQQQYVSDAREAERRYGLLARHQTVEEKAFDVNTSIKRGFDPVTGAKLPDPAAAERRKERNQVNQWGVKNKDWAKMSPDERVAWKKRWEAAGRAPGKPPKPKDPDTGAKKDLRKAVDLVQKGLRGKKTAPASYWQQAYDALLNENKDMDPALARAAVQLVRGGKVGPDTRRTLERDYGLTRRDYPKGTKRKKPDPYKLPDRPGNAPAGPDSPTARPTRYNPDRGTGPVNVPLAIRRRREAILGGPHRRQVS